MTTAREVWATGERVALTAVLPEDLRLHHECWLDPEAMRPATALVFERVALPYVVAGAYEHNLASLRMLAKVGFRRTPKADTWESNRFGAGKVRQLAFRLDRI